MSRIMKVTAIGAGVGIVVAGIILTRAIILARKSLKESQADAPTPLPNQPN